MSEINCSGKGLCLILSSFVKARYFLIRRRAQREIISDGEDGANPSRCRHCKRGAILHFATVRRDVIR
jgi:hypothetical protein